MVTADAGRESDQIEQPRNPRDRPSRLTPELQEQIRTAIREGGCTYA